MCSACYCGRRRSQHPTCDAPMDWCIMARFVFELVFMLPRAAVQAWKPMNQDRLTTGIPKPRTALGIGTRKATTSRRVEPCAALLPPQQFIRMSCICCSTGEDAGMLVCWWMLEQWWENFSSNEARSRSSRFVAQREHSCCCSQRQMQDRRCCTMRESHLQPAPTTRTTPGFDDEFVNRSE